MPSIVAWLGCGAVILRLATALCLCLGAGAGAALAQPNYRDGPASEDGIGKFYDGREIARVMGFEGASWLERPTREQEERPDVLVRELALKPGMMVADIGAGSGYLSRRMAPRVAPGKVFAVDVQPQMVALLEHLSRRPGMDNLVPSLGASDDVQLAPESLDLAVMVDVYHELEFPYMSCAACCARSGPAAASCWSNTAARTRGCRSRNCTR